MVAGLVVSLGAVFLRAQSSANPQEEQEFKLSTQAEASEMALRLHETPIQDPSLGVQQIHAQLQNLCLEMHSLKQDTTPRPEA